MFCATHKQFFHAEINEDCPGCIKEQEKCQHLNKGASQLFNSKRYLGYDGEWDVCYDCGKMIKC